jgi:hypothetical protein
MTRSGAWRITFYFPGSPFYRTDGCMVRGTQMLRFLSESVDVDFYSFPNHSPWPWTTEHHAELATEYPRVRIHLDRLTPFDPWIVKAKNADCALFPRSATAIAQFTLPFRHPQWRAVKKNSVHLINYVDGLTQVNGIARYARIIVGTHDIGLLASIADSGKAGPFADGVAQAAQGDGVVHHRRIGAIGHLWQRNGPAHRYLPRNTALVQG